MSFENIINLMEQNNNLELFEDNELNEMKEFYTKHSETYQSFDEFMEAYLLQDPTLMLIKEKLQCVSSLNGTWSLQCHYYRLDKMHCLEYEIFDHEKDLKAHYHFVFSLSLSLEYICLEAKKDDIDIIQFQAFASILVGVMNPQVNSELALDVVYDAKEDVTVQGDWVYRFKTDSDYTFYAFLK